jgi:predicted transcriptional regulator
MFDRPMSASEISAELGVSRQDVSQRLKSAMVKIFRNVSEMDESSGPFEVCVSMIQHLNVDQTPEELKKFFRLLPHSIKELIVEDGKRLLPDNPIILSIADGDDDEDTEV